MKITRRASNLLLVSTLFLCFLSIALIGMVAVITVQRSARSDVSDLADALLERAGTQFSFYLSQTRRIAYEVFEDESVKTLVGQSSPDPRLALFVDDFLDDILIIHDYIHSVTIATPERIVASSTQEKAEAEKYPDVFAQISGWRPLMPIPLIRAAPNGQARNVLMLYYHGFGYHDAPAERYVLVTLDADCMSRYVGGTNDGAIVAIADPDGRVLSASHSVMTGVTLPFSDNDAVTMVDVIAGAIGMELPAPFVRFASWNEGRLLGVYVGKAPVFDDATTAIIISIVLGILCVGALATAFVFWLLRALYRPISSVFDAGAETLGAIGSNDKLKSIADRVIQHLDHLNRIGKQLLTVEETRFLRRLLLSTVPVSDGIIAAELEKAGLVGPDESPVIQVAVLRIDGGLLSMSDTTFSSIRTFFAAIRADSDVIFRDTCKSQVVEISDDQLVLLCFFGSDTQENTAAACSGIQLLLGQIKRNYEVSMTAGVAAPVLRPADLRSAYRRALSLSNNRFFLGPGRLITIQDVDQRRRNAFDDETVRSFIADLSDAARHSDVASFRTKNAELFRYLVEFEYSEILSVAAEIAYALSNFRGGGPNDSAGGHVSYLDLYDQLSAAESIAELTEVIARIQQRMADHLENLRSQASDHMISQGLAYIEERRHDPLLSASDVAEKLGITPQYFSQIFHNVTGKSFPQYLNDIRLLKAYELFQTSRQLSVQDVYRAVGYRSRNHFTTLFKAKFALTPSQMRQRSINLINGGQGQQNEDQE